VLRVNSLERDDQRAYDIAVAGPGALLVAKLHKITERLADSRAGDRSRDKDAADVYRLFQATSVESMGAAVTRARQSSVAGGVTEAALQQLQAAFGKRGATGVIMAVRAAAANGDEAAAMEAACLAYTEGLLERLSES